MRLIRTLTTLSPLLLKGPTKRPFRFWAGSMAAYALFIVSGIFITTAAFIWINVNYGADAAFLAIGLGIALFAAYVLWRSRRNIGLEMRPEGSLSTAMETDPLMKNLPDSVRTDPMMRTLLEHIEEHPVPATVAGLTMGMLLANEVFGD